MATEVLVQREKQDQHTFGPSRFHYVRETNHAGHVLGLTERKDEALRMSRDEAQKILDYHADRKNAGTFTILDA